MDLFELLADGATLVTVNERLARDLRLAYAHARQAAGEGVWERPRIMGWQSWLASCHAALADAAFAGGEPPRPLMDAPRAQVFWEEIIAAAPGTEMLLPPAVAANLAAQAWMLAHAFRIDIADVRRTADPDSRAFADWAEAYAERVDAAGWVDPASLPQHLAEAFKAGRLSPPRHLVLAGFDDLTPAQRYVLDSLRGVGCRIDESQLMAEAGESRAVRIGLPDSEHEIKVAARWTRSRLAQDPGARVAIVVPDLADKRARIARLFMAELAPAASASSQSEPAPFNISLGLTLDSYPVVAAALGALRLIRGRVPLVDLGRLLRGPFLGDAEHERGQRARLDARLRDGGGETASVDWLVRLASEHAPALHARLEAWQTWRSELPASQGAGAWADAFTRGLRCLGWPGERVLDSAEHQTVQAFHSVLTRFADLDDWLGPLTATGALNRLGRALRERIFQPESESVGVQILGTLEASGQQFDHLWVMGLHDGVWPAAPRPHPLLPAGLQRQLQMPHASAERELQFARQVTARLLAAAPEVIASWPLRDGDAELRVSPLLSHLPEIDVGSLELESSADWRRVIGQTDVLETFVDEQAPPLATTGARGGTALLKDQAACPFRAFARHRLHARPLASPAAGLDPAARGELMHRALEMAWGELGTHARLEAEAEDGLRDIAARAAGKAVADAAKRRPDVFSDAWRALEQARVESLLLAWLELERTRAPFTVIERELDARVPVGGLELRTRIDRIDRLADGTLAVIDYKTGKVSERGWFGERPDEPQLPLYACAVGDDLGAVLFAQVRAGEMRFRGISREEAQVPGVATIAASKTLPPEVEDWPALLGAWAHHLAALAESYRAGDARVNPKSADSCKYCHLGSLCRIDERLGLVLAGDEDDE